jgi:hypothetical protein
MASRITSLRTVVAFLAVLTVGCLDSPSPTSPQVFVGRYADDVTFQPFKDTSASDVAPDATTCFPPTSTFCPDGGASLKVTVPGPGQVGNVFAGGAFVAGIPRNLSGYDAVTFWARSTRPAPVIVGLGSDNSGNSLYPAEWNAALTTEWTRYILPIPLPTKLSAERGLLYFAAGADGSPATGFTFWLSNIEYVTTAGALGRTLPAVPPACVTKVVGDAAFRAFMVTTPDKVPVNVAVNAENQLINSSRRYFTFSSSDPTVASIDVAGMVTIQGKGSATIRGTLGGADAVGPLTVVVGGGACPAVPAPTEIAPAPAEPPVDPILLYSSTSSSNPSWIIWRTVWSPSGTKLDAYPVTPANAVKKYSLQSFAGISFLGFSDNDPTHQIDASKMTFFHVDVWTPDAVVFSVRLVNDATAYKSESTVQVNLSDPALRKAAVPRGGWIGLDIPMTAFVNLGGTSKLGQMLFLVPDGTSATVYVDNVYFHN